jgi:hypothetical protein
MHTLTATALTATSIDISTTHSPPPVDDLLQVYLGHSSGSRAPEPARRNPALDVLDLWDYLGDFA